MTSLNRSHVEEIAHRLSVKIFDEEMTRHNLSHSYYQQNPNPPHPYYQQIPSQPQVDLNYNPQITFLSSQYNTDTAFVSHLPPNLVIMQTDYCSCHDSKKIKI
jgi:hypothetical protein